MRRPAADDDLLVCADVLGAFGVTASDVGRDADGTLETALADALAAGHDRTTVLRRTIARADRGIGCAARHAGTSVAGELSGVLGALGWSTTWEWERDDRFVLEATDGAGRRREVTVTYPETPLGTENLPAALVAIEDVLLDGVDATFVSLSRGEDRWRAALIETDELARLRDRYGERIEPFDRPLLPPHDLEAYVPGESGRRGDAADDPWPEWARETPTRASASADLVREAEPEAGGLVEEAESRTSGFVREAEPAATTTAAESTTLDPNAGSTVDSAADADGLELLGGSPTVSRSTGGESPAGTDGSNDGRRDDETDERTEPALSSGAADEDDDGFGTLSGTVATARVSNDSFGTDDAPASTDDRYLALGAAIGSGNDVSVTGLLEDDEFLPEIPAAERVETRIEFAEAFDPAAVSTAKAAAEREGFVWVDSGSLETTRISSG